MEKLPANMEVAIGSYAPIRAEGLLLWPVRVRDWNEYGAAKAAIGFLQQSLPVTLLSVPLLQAYYRLYLDALALPEEEKGTPKGGETQMLGMLFFGAVCHILLSLRLHDGLPMERRLRCVQIETDPNDTTRLKRLRFIHGVNETYEITPLQFQRLRPILAAQNGVELAPDDANPEIVAMEQRLRLEQQRGILFDVHRLVAAMAALTHTEEADIYEWPILKLNQRAEAFSRVLDYLAVSVGQCSGLVSYRDGSPVPSPWFRKKETGLLSLTPAGELGKIQDRDLRPELPKALAFLKNNQMRRNDKNV